MRYLLLVVVFIGAIVCTQDAEASNRGRNNFQGRNNFRGLNSFRGLNVFQGRNSFQRQRFQRNNFFAQPVFFATAARTHFVPQAIVTHPVFIPQAVRYGGGYSSYQTAPVFNFNGASINRRLQVHQIQRLNTRGGSRCASFF
jgi:hypothetical protein